jgi:hypothetical protein
MDTTLLGIPLMLAFLKAFIYKRGILTSCFLVNSIGLVFEALKLTHQSDPQVLRLFKSEFSGFILIINNTIKGCIVSK